jgi:GT2 family glycosyltransferase
MTAHDAISSCKVVVVVLNWNGWRDSLRCLESLHPAVLQGLAKIIVVDNASTDNSVSALREWFKGKSIAVLEFGQIEITSAETRLAATHYVMLRAAANAGYAAGNNLGIRFALRHADPEYVFVVNNDTTVGQDAIARLVEWADQDESIGAVGSTILENDGALRIAGGSRYNRFLTMARPVRVANGASKVDLDYVSGAALFVRASALRQVGLLSEDYFLYFEELDFTRRLRRAGLRISWCPESVIHHKGGASAGSRSCRSGKSVLAEYHSNLSCLIFTRKFHPFLFWLSAPTRFILKIINDSMRRELSMILPLFRAYRDYALRVMKGPA